ncbi:MAG: isocitrate lyase/PEP mutase family protein [Thermofilaceae archaeon]
MKSKVRLLSELLNQEGIIVAPGAYDALSAKLIEWAGFPAVYLSGAAVSASLIGYPDVGLLSFSEMLGHAQKVIQAVKIPVIVDADTGYGNAINVIRTVREFEQIGAAAIHLEDQAFPKRCGHLEDKKLISIAEMVKKVEAALYARSDPDFIIIARTDARALYGLDEAIRRGRTYYQAGADVIFIEALDGEEEIRRVAESIEAPLLINLGGGGKTPMLSVRHLEKLGFKIAIYPGDLQKSAIKVMQELLLSLKANGTTEEMASRMVTFEERFELLGLEEIRQLEDRFLIKERATQEEKQ